MDKFRMDTYMEWSILEGMWERSIKLGLGKTFSSRRKDGIGKIMLVKVFTDSFILSTPNKVTEAVARGFEIELERFGTADCYFKSLPLELIDKRNKIVKILSDAGLNPIIPEGGYFILADVRNLNDVGGDLPKQRFRFVMVSRNRKLKQDENLDKAGEILAKLKADLEAGKV
ncbi:Kynurenine--oxoglutarate transaminase 3 [Armadillidium vulgare]|nr:Kynurenine--oxoglutarate transaminase 3 [Armadillidium vulgare]